MEFDLSSSRKHSSHGGVVGCGVVRKGFFSSCLLSSVMKTVCPHLTVKGCSVERLLLSPITPDG